MRIAWFSPLPPHRSGIAAYCAELLPRLGRHDIEAFVDEGPGADPAARADAIGGLTVRDAHDFPWCCARRPYDAIVYHVGNDSCHDYMWPYLARYPGLVVLHDAQLLQARARGLIRQRREADFKAEFVYANPGVPPIMADLIVAGLGRTVCYSWPMVRVPVESARVVAVHNAWLARQLAEEFPGRAIRRIHMGVADPQQSPGAPAREVRGRHGIPGDAVVFGAFGRATPEKGLAAVLCALAQVASSLPDIRLVIVGDVPPYYDVMAQARELGVERLVVQTGYVPDRALPEYLAAVDVCLNLRWPTGRETSAAWLRCLAAGKPTVISDLVHQGDVPSLDVRAMSAPGGTPAPGGAICLRIDLLEDVKMLRLALRRLTEDTTLRSQLGRAARAYWEREATLEVMVQDYEVLLEDVRRAADPARPAGWPAHLAADGSVAGRALVAAMGVPWPLDVADAGCGPEEGR